VTDSGSEPKNVAAWSTASLPGRVRLDIGLYYHCYPNELCQTIFAAFILLVYVAIAVFLWRFPGILAKMVLIVLVMFGAWAIVGEKLTRIRLKSQMFHGCANPAVVVNMNPCLLAVYADLAARPDVCYPAVKVIYAPLDRVPGKRFQVGDRVPTISTYRGGVGDFHSDFYPVPACCATNDQEALTRLFVELEEGNESWNTLETAMSSVPRPYYAGLFPVEIFFPVSDDEDDEVTEDALTMYPFEDNGDQTAL